MDASTTEIVAGLKRAIQLEGDGYNFYKMAAVGTSDAKGREVFEMLAREEAEHARFLRAQYDSFLETGRANRDVKLPAHGVLDREHPIFSAEIKTRLQDAHMEMSALAIGIQLELGSIQHYQQQRDQHQSADVKAFFQELVEWEQEHHDALNRQRQLLLEDYWAQGGFSPF